ncbi:hypothetical protein Poli38472_013229 [Pythium oligandrum]|uniref:FYVE-type domain-containing protein n=1 Tax=Pythium oligandrum TaxID=41045 RepID=A0A8K1C2N8_PYTOL|nr:hypothetical protein Poli38472_013229 [Pythium oligandrum]|eukprot:TMW55338.1 hypothetical protein Poli38472_013229 [Pythium oligandrum]
MERDAESATAGDYVRPSSEPTTPTSLACEAHSAATPRPQDDGEMAQPSADQKTREQANELMQREDRNVRFPDERISMGSSDSNESEVSVVPTLPTQPPPNVRSISASAVYKPFPPSKDHGLQIFFPTDDLAIKAILSPSALRTASAGGRLASASTASSSSSTPSTPAPQQRPSTTFAGSLIEQTSRLFFSRGQSTPNLSEQYDSALESSSVSPPPVDTSLKNRATAVSIALEEDLAKLNNNILVTHPNLPPPPFANMFSCENCHNDIGSLLTQGRHHCRNCGGSFCSACSSKNITVPFQHYLSKGEQRVCDGCYSRIREFHSQAKTTNVTWCGLPPPSLSTVLDEFDLPETDPPVTIFNCSYFVDFAPTYGHLFLTREHVCFKGYKAYSFKIPYADLHSLVKPEFYYINALQLSTKSKEKHFFAEFNGLRDLCFLRMDQLIRAYREGKKQHPTEMSSEDLVEQAKVRRKSYRAMEQQVTSSSGKGEPRRHQQLASMMAGNTSGYMDVDDEDDDESTNEKRRASPSDDVDERMSFTSDDEPFVPLPPDQLLSKMTVLLDCEIRADVQTVFDQLWNNGPGQRFLRGSMENANDIDIEIEDWKPVEQAKEDLQDGFVISKEDDYSQYRYVRSQHPPKVKFPGLPPYATCSRLQRLRIEKTTDGDNEKWTRFVIADRHRMTKIPFSDYFEIETRWVFSRDGQNYCHVQAGLIVNFIKSTWFKSQINSSTMSESKEVMDEWMRFAILDLKSHEHSGKGPQVRQASTVRRGSIKTRLSVVAETASTASASSNQESSPSSVEPATPTASTTTSTAIASLPGAMPLSLPAAVQCLSLLVLAYCVLVIHRQANQLQRLTDVTLRLMEQMHGSPQRRSGAIDVNRGEVCSQTIIDGVAGVLKEYFESQ